MLPCHTGGAGEKVAGVLRWTKKVSRCVIVGKKEKGRIERKGSMIEKKEKGKEREKKEKRELIREKKREEEERKNK